MKKETQGEGKTTRNPQGGKQRPVCGGHRLWNFVHGIRLRTEGQL